MVSKNLKLSRIAEQGQHATTDQMGGCFVSAGQEGHAGGKQFLFAQPLTLLLGGDHCADQVFSRVFPPFCNDTAVVTSHL